jgi:hypothetical protein
MIQFGGHHLGLNVAMIGKRGVLAPAPIGAQPAAYFSDGKTVRALRHENDAAFDLLSSFDESQRKQRAVPNTRAAIAPPAKSGQPPRNRKQEHDRRPCRRTGSARP